MPGLRWTALRLDDALERLKGDQWDVIDGGELPMPVALRVGRRRDDGRLVCTGLILGTYVTDDDGELMPAEGKNVQEITARDLRSIPLGEILTGRLASLLRLGFPADSGSYEGPRARGGPKGYPREHFEGVAAAYRRALHEAPRAPIKTLAAQLHTSEATARRWVRRARDLELLTEAPE